MTFALPEDSNTTAYVGVAVVIIVVIVGIMACNKKYLMQKCYGGKTNTDEITGIDEVGNRN